MASIFAVSTYSILFWLLSLRGFCQEPVVVGTLPNLQHGISGTLELLSTTEMRVRGFSYDGNGPAAFLYYYPPGTTSSRFGGGIKISYPGGRTDGAFRLGTRFTNELITFSMPANSDVCDIGTFTIWCEAARSFFTSIEFPRTLFARNGNDPCTLASAVTTAPPTTPPTTSVVVGTLPTLLHQVGGMLTFLSTTRIRIVGFSYDGTAPATFLYSFPPGAMASRNGGGVKIPLGTNNGGTSDGAFKTGIRYSNQDLTVDLPAGMDVCDIGTFTVWCEHARVFFSTLEVSRTLFENNGNDPCTLKMSTTVVPSDDDFENCEIFSDSMQLRWTVERAQSLIHFMLSGCQSTSVAVPQYMGFGLSGSTTATSMDNADVTIAWLGNNGQPNAVDYFLRSRTQCRAGMGVCPDEMDSRGGTCTNNVGNITGKTSSREQKVSFTRPFDTGDSDCDIPFNVDSDQYIVWAIGGVEQTAFRHNFRSDATTAPIRFNRTAKNNCGTKAISCSTCAPFPAKRMDARTGSTIFRAAIGPSGNARGYTALTNQVGWGIAWYINDSLVPELVVERGKTYTFIIEGGSDPSDSPNYHPFYITGSSIGGRLLNTPAEKNAEKVYAGISSSGQPTAVGRLCSSIETEKSFQILDRCGSFNEFKNSLSKTCRDGQPGILRWTPDINTPDIVYYQCATHRNLGWKIHVTGRSPVLTMNIMVLIAVTGMAIMGFQ